MDSFYPLQTFRPYVNDELERRKLNYGLEKPSDINTPYKGSYNAWCRVTSLVDVKFGNDTRQGFVLYTNDSFENMYGIPHTKKHGILGYDREGNPHTNRSIGYPNVVTPPPGVVSMDTELQGGDGGKFRTMSFKIKCNDKWQLEYLTPYFLTAGNTILVEWGWSNFNPQSLVNLSDPTDIKKIYTDWANVGYRRRLSNGNYDAFVGIVTKFGYSITETGGYDCDIELKTISEMVNGLSNKSEDVTKDNDEGKKESLQKTETQLKLNIDSYISGEIQSGGWIWDKKTADVSEGELENRFVGFSAELFEDQGDGRDSNIKQEEGWMPFELLIHLINKWKGVSGEQNTDQLLSFNIENSWISASPNLKSIDGSVLLIPNMYTPAYQFKQDNINFNGLKNLNIQSDTNDVSEKIKSANNAMVSALNKFNDVYDGYEQQTERVNLANIIVSPGRIASQGFSNVCFPHPLKLYTGHIKNLYVSKTVVIDAFMKGNSLIDTMYEILRKMSDAACGIWDFDILDVGPDGAGGLEKYDILESSDNKYQQLTIYDRNFCGLKNGEVQDIDTLLTNSTNNGGIYSISSIDYLSNIRKMSFGVELSDQVAAQTLMSENMNNTPREDDKFFQRISLGSKKNKQQVIIHDWLSRFVKSNKVEVAKIEEDEPEKQVNPKADNEEEYYTVEFDVEEGLFERSKNITIRLAEPNSELIQNAIKGDTNSQNCSIYNGAIPGTELSVDFTGISGIRFMDILSVSNLPFPYNEQCIFQVKNVKHQLNGNDWNTTVEAILRSSPSFLKDQSELQDNNNE